jgi:hypothetical protein
MQRTDFVIPECYIDTNLVETLVCHGGCNHQKGCNHVTGIMQTKFADRFAVGIIDADKRRPQYVNEFKEVAATQHIQLLRHPQKQHFIILLHPAADGFILACAADAGIDMSHFNLSPNLKEFTAQTKNVMSDKDFRFKQLFRAMENSGEMKLLKSVLSYLVTHTYQSSNTDLASLFQ